MRSTRIFVAALCLPFTLFAQDSTSAARGDETLMQRLGLHGIHVSFGGGATPYMGRSTGTANTSDIRIGATPRRWPDWTIAFAASAVGDWDSTSYVAPNSDGYHPRLAATTSGVEVQRRWSSSRLFHFVATAGAGELVNSYNYYRFPKSGGSEFHQEEVTRVSYATLMSGAEVNVSGWARMLMTVGYRGAGSTRVVGGVGSNSGFASSVMLEMGKF